MRNLIVVCALVLSGCLSAPLSQQEMGKVKSVSIVDIWTNHVSKSNFSSITATVANPTSDKVAVSVNCIYAEDGVLFGNSDMVNIPPFTKTKVMVRGIVRDRHFTWSIDCSVKR